MCSTDILHAKHQTTLRTSASLPYTLGKCVVGYKEETCLIGVGRTSDIMWCNWEHTLYETVWEHSGRIALLKCWVNVLCIFGSVKYIRYKTTHALKLFQETQSWIPDCTCVAYFTTGILLRPGTNETEVRKQTDVADWWNWMRRTLMCGSLWILSKRGTASFYILVRNSNVMSEHSTRFPHFRIPAKRLLK